MKKTIRIASVLMALVMVFSLQLNAMALENAVAPVEQPSTWAMEGVQWSEAYGLVSGDMLGKYASKVTREELYALCVNLYEKISETEIKPLEKSPFSDSRSQTVLKACAIKILSGTGKFEPMKEASRLDMVSCILNAIKAAQPDFNLKSDIKLSYTDTGKIPAKSLDVVKYAVSKELLKGRGNNTLDLYATCNRQELMVFAKKAYEFTMYELGRDSKGAFWKVSDEDSTVYLLGSIHLTKPSTYPLSKNILNAYEKSDALVVEVNLSNQLEAAAYMQQKAMYTDDNTLDKNVSKEAFNRFVELVKPLGVPEETCKKLKPWYAALLVQNIQLAQGDYNANIGIDMFFMNKAVYKKDILEIEGIKFQVDLFDSFSKELQVQFLEGVLGLTEGASVSVEDSQKNQVDSIDAMTKCWKSGDMAELAKILLESEGSTEQDKEFNEKVFAARDSNMVQKVKGYLADPEKKTYFIVVGAGHMVGKTGIVPQLEGVYKIEQIK